MHLPIHGMPVNPVTVTQQAPSLCCLPFVSTGFNEMAGPERKRTSRRNRLPTLLPAAERRPVIPRPSGIAPRLGEEESIYTLRGYKAWAARVKAAWDQES